MINYILNLLMDNEYFAKANNYQHEGDNLSPLEIQDFNLVIPDDIDEEIRKKFEYYRDNCVAKESEEKYYCVLAIEDPDRFFDQLLSTITLIRHTVIKALKAEKPVRFTYLNADSESLKRYLVQACIETYFGDDKEDD